MIIILHNRHKVQQPASQQEPAHKIHKRIRVAVRSTTVRCHIQHRVQIVKLKVIAVGFSC